MNEVWKDIPNYENLYQVSNLGRVKSLKKEKKRKNNCKQTFQEKILSQGLGENGYLTVQLFKNKIGKTFTVHKLIAQTFISNPNNYVCINHKDENKLNNCVDNLEWCTYKYNNNYNSKSKKIRLKLINGKLSKRVLQYDLQDNFIKEWESTREIERVLNYKNQSISACCLNKNKTSYGYKWCYKKD